MKIVKLTLVFGVGFFTGVVSAGVVIATKELEERGYWSKLVSNIEKDVDKWFN